MEIINARKMITIKSIKNIKQKDKEILRLFRKSVMVIRKRGLYAMLLETKNYIKTKIFLKKSKFLCKDFLFISGCYIEMPQRYRCEFQKEQLEKQGLAGEVKFFTEISNEWLKYYDIFILYRVPITDEVENFIKKAKQLNKLVIFDIDDLVFDKKLVKNKHEVREMSVREREIYFDGIDRHKKTMKLCDYGIASTEAIAKHMKKHISTVFINRNSASDNLIFRSKKAWKNKKKSKLKNKIVLGYFSGSKTHDDDIRLIENVLVNIFDKYSEVVLMIVGPLQLSPLLQKYENRIIRKKFVKYEKLPNLIAQIDINLAPLVVNEFNNGKSEIKYTETALVKKPTVASDAEAFVYAIKNGETGFIAKNDKEWFDKISKLIEDSELRRSIAENAYQSVTKNYNTKTLGKNFLKFINQHRQKKIIYVSPSTKISGGVMVICQHLKRLQKRGYNTSFITLDNKNTLDWFSDFNVPVIPYNIFQHSKSALIDIAVATLWSTVGSVKKCMASKKYYLVQNKEHLFYKEGDANFAKAKKTYLEKNIEFITISKWCQKWLEKEFGKSAKYIPNGISRKTFYKTDALNVGMKNDKVRILIEGNPDDDYKNVDESFKIANRLDKNKFEVWFISYGGKPKKWYKYDDFFQKVPYEKMKNFYSNCDILLKTSRLESFSYPPLEMMACGGVCVVAENGGNKEYVKNNYNALTYKLGKINDAVQKIEKLAIDNELKTKLINNGMKTVKDRNWKKSIDILEEVLLVGK